jgi:hypothetical protein
MSDSTQSDLPKSSSNTHDGCDYIKENNLIYQRMADGGRFMNSSRDVTDRMLSLFNNDNQPREHKVFNNTNVNQINTAAENPDVNRKGYDKSLNNIFKNGTAPWEILDFVGGTSCKPQTHLDGHDYTLDWKFLEKDSVQADSRGTLPSSWRGVLTDIDRGKNWYSMTLSELTSALTGIKPEYLEFIVTYLQPRMTELMGWLQTYNNSLNGGTYQRHTPSPDWSMVSNARAAMVEEYGSLKLYDIMRTPDLIGNGKQPPDLMDEIYLINRLFDDAVTTYSDLTAEQCRSLCNIDDGCAPTCTDPERCRNPQCTRCMGLPEYQTYQAGGCNIPSNVDESPESRWKQRLRDNRNNFMATRSVDECKLLAESGNRYSVDQRPIWSGGTQSANNAVYYQDIFDTTYGPCRNYEGTLPTPQVPTNSGIQKGSNLWNQADGFSLYPFRKN